MTHQLKIVLCGAKGVGKTSAWFMWLYGKTLDKCPYNSQDDLLKHIEIDGVRFSCEYHEVNTDPESQHFPAMDELYMRDSDAVLLMYSVTDPISYDNIETIKKKIETLKKEHPKPYSNPNMVTPMLIWQNKTDLENERVISADRGEELAALLKLPMVRGSARDKEQTGQIFNHLLQLYLAAQRNANNAGTSNNNSNKTKASTHRECITM